MVIPGGGYKLPYGEGATMVDYSSLAYVRIKRLRAEKLDDAALESKRVDILLARAYADDIDYQHSAAPFMHETVVLTERDEHIVCTPRG